jgi:hypothetical protein
MLGSVDQAFDTDDSVPGACPVSPDVPQWIVGSWKPGSTATRGGDKSATINLYHSNRIDAFQNEANIYISSISTYRTIILDPTPCKIPS